MKLSSRKSLLVECFLYSTFTVHLLCALGLRGLYERGWPEQGRLAELQELG